MTSPATDRGSALISSTRDAVSRAVRQGIQALIPTLIVLAGGNATGLDVPAVLELTGVTVLISIARSVTDVRAPDSAALWKRVADRSLAAFAGSWLGWLTIDGTIPAVHVAWSTGLVASLGAAAASAAMMYTNRPPTARGFVGAHVRGDR